MLFPKDILYFVCCLNLKVYIHTLKMLLFYFPCTDNCNVLLHDSCNFNALSESGRLQMSCERRIVQQQHNTCTV